MFYGIFKIIEHLWDLVNSRTAIVLKKKGRTDIKMAVRKRAALNRKRKILMVLFVLVLVLDAIFSLVIAIALFKSDELSWFCRIVGGITLLIFALNELCSISFEIGGNISTYKAEDVIGSGIKYALYLRPFEADYRKISFKEEELVLALNKEDIITVAVGIPEEVDAPIGSVRVYVDNNTWKEEVRALMERASLIFVRIGDTEACLWELNQVLSLPNKLFLIIEGDDEYGAVYSKCPNIPDNVTIPEGQFCIFERMEDGKWEESYLMAKKKVKDVINDDSLKRIVKQDGPLIWNKSFSNAYVKSMLDFYPIPNKASLLEFEKTITNLDKKTIKGLGYDNNNIIANRLMDLMEAYCRVGGDGLMVATKIKEYLQLLERYEPLTEDLQLRKERMAKKVEQVMQSFMVIQNSPPG